MMLLLVTTAFAGDAGYGVPVGGYPSAAERRLVLWTNAARVAPDAFTSDYQSGGCSTKDFSADELTPKPPLYIDLNLSEAARYHSEDMRDNGCFQHESCDGTDTWTRIASFYDEGSTMGENIAMGSSDPRYSVLSMWMCSHSGHRANIMSGSYNEMGGGIAGSYMTQDFAAGILPSEQPPVRVAADEDDGVYADWGDASPPARLELVVDGQASAMQLVYGEDDNGIYFVAPAGLGGESVWYVRWQTKGGVSGSFPASGSFGVGGGDGDDAWTDARAGDGGGGDDTDDDAGDIFGDPDQNEEMTSDLAVTGCATAGAGAGWLGLAGAIGGLLARRRRA